MHPYLPKRNDIIFIDFEPVKGKEIGKVRPALVLSSEEYNKKNRSGYYMSDKYKYSRRCD
ncbi:type II toxin-antitoxin system PemK/MazF family toxin [Xenorhabdus nematophila]|uniref:type II toxin-antitoxin system PemK/MazF family toxin n=2 Tax=Xenorhabdus nematophila TaxID=628 RepID=UPI0022AC65DE|nr:type II toxin-antitoxin system PemK/MazF family toxin [Xenorhabdus nematophila]